MTTDNLPSAEAVREVRALMRLDASDAGIELSSETIHTYLTQTDEGRALVRDATNWNKHKDWLANGEKQP